MTCPLCKNVQLVLSERHGIEIDYCPQCRGIWLDRGEIDKMVEHFSKVQTGAPTAPRAPSPDLDRPRPPRAEYDDRERSRDRYEDRDRDDDDRKRRKRGGLLDGLMDIFD